MCHLSKESCILTISVKESDDLNGAEVIASRNHSRELLKMDSAGNNSGHPYIITILLLKIYKTT